MPIPRPSVLAGLVACLLAGAGRCQSPERPPPAFPGLLPDFKRLSELHTRIAELENRAEDARREAEGLRAEEDTLRVRPPEPPKAAAWDRPLEKAAKAALAARRAEWEMLYGRIRVGLDAADAFRTVAVAARMTAAADDIFPAPMGRLPWYEFRVRNALWVEQRYVVRAGATLDGVRHGIDPPHHVLIAIAARLDAEIALAELKAAIKK